jgi:phosphohistidine phosphatase
MCQQKPRFFVTLRKVTDLPTINSSTMKSLILLRHAKSSWADPGISDYDRPLNDRGKRDAPRVGEVFVERGISPGLVLSSSAKRARKTARKLLDASGLDVELRLLDEFYLAAPETYIRELQKLPDDIQQVVVVGHNPGLEELVRSLVGRHEHLPTAALVLMELPIDSWTELRINTAGSLAWIWTPSQDED